MRVSLNHSLTTQISRDEQMRKGAQLANKGTIRKLLEELADNDRPIIVEIYGAKKDRQPDDYFLRECRGLLIYEGVNYQALEKNRREEEGEVAASAARQVKLNEIKVRLRAELKDDNGDFDRRFDAQSRLQNEATEREIGEKAEAILGKEEAEEEQLNK